MTFLLPIFGFVAVLIFLLVWSLRPARKRGDVVAPESLCIERADPRCATHYPIVLRAVSPRDIAYIAERALPGVARRVRRERRRVVFLYLEELRQEFERLLQLARVISALSPEVAAGLELQQVHLSMQFMWRYRLVRAGLHSGLVLLPQLNGISQMAGSLAHQLEKAMRELGERAALAAEVASSLDRGGVQRA